MYLYANHATNYGLQNATTWNIFSIISPLLGEYTVVYPVIGNWNL